MRFRSTFISLILGLAIQTNSPAQETAPLPSDFYLNKARELYHRSQYDSLPWYYEQAGKICGETGDSACLAECMLGMCEYHRIRQELGPAETLLDSATRFIGHWAGQGSLPWTDLLYFKAKLRISQDRYGEAENLIRECLDLRTSLGADQESIANTLNILGTIHHFTGDYAHAEMYYLEAYQYFSERDPGPAVEKGWLLYNLGLVYSDLGQAGKWLEMTKAAIDNNIALYGKDFPDLGTSYSTLVSYYFWQGQIDSARYYLDRSEDIYLAAFGKDHHELAQVYSNRARILSLEGNYYTALEYYREAERIQAGSPSNESYFSYILYINIAFLYRSLGDYETAGSYYRKLLSAEGRVHPTRMAAFYHHNAINETSLGNFREAEMYFNKVFRIREAHYSPDHFGWAFVFRTYGVLLDSLERYDEADRYYQTALQNVRRHYGENHYSTASYLKRTGDHYLLKGEAGNALGYYQDALHSLVPGYDTAGISNNPRPEEVQDHMFYLALLKQKAASLEMLADPGDNGSYLLAAFEAYRLSVEITAFLRNSYLNDQSKLYLSEYERITYENMMRCAYELYLDGRDPYFFNEAFKTAEKAKYATLLSVMQRSGALQLGDVPDSIRQEITALQRDLAVSRELLLEARTDTVSDPVRIEQYSRAVFNLSDRVEQLSKEMEEKFPRYYELLYGQDVADPVQALRLLGQDDMLIEYFMTGSDLYIFVVSERGNSFSRVPVEAEFLNDMGIIDEYMSSHYLTGSERVDHGDFLAAANRLYHILMPEKMDAERLLLIPEGQLAYFPFDILVSEPVTEFNGKFSDVPFLMRDYPIQYAYSATLIRSARHERRNSRGKLVAFAPGYIDQQQDPAGGETTRQINIDRMELSPLPGTIREVTEIGGMTGGRVFTGPGASESSFRQWAPASNIIHLATHAFLDDAEPLFSKLVFSEETGRVEDGFLNVFEIYNLEMKASLVVLSACNTGAGMLKGGEGIMSLARAFLYAGIPSAVMTLWTVSDEQSYLLMESFYKYLIQGNSTAESLRMAKLDMLAGEDLIYQHPQFWAGYIAVGEDEVIYRKRSWIALLAGGLLAGILAFVLMLRRGRRV